MRAVLSSMTLLFVACSGLAKPVISPEAAQAWPDVPRIELEDRMMPAPARAFPSPAIKTEMIARQLFALKVGLRFCVDEDGELQWAGVEHASDLPAYDADALAVVKGWRFEGSDRAVCTHVELVYLQPPKPTTAPQTQPQTQPSPSPVP